MAQIFISHSRKDPERREWLRSLFGDTTVRAVCKEFDEYRVPPWADIDADLQRSQAVFLLLTPAVCSSSHTTNWVSHEVSSALSLFKPLWILEEMDSPVDFPIPAAHPTLTHYVPYYRGWNGRDDFIRQIIRGYEDPDIASTVLAVGVGAAGGAALAEDKGVGAIIGSFSGIVLKLLSQRQPPSGVIVHCPYPTCGVSFQVHVQVPSFPCPSCRQTLVWQPSPSPLQEPI